MRPEEPDHDDPASVVHRADQSIVISLDIEDHPTDFENAGLRMRLLHLLGRRPLCRLRDGTPGIVLRPGCLDPFMAGSCREITLDEAVCMLGPEKRTLTNRSNLLRTSCYYPLRFWQKHAVKKASGSG